MYRFTVSLSADYVTITTTIAQLVPNVCIFGCYYLCISLVPDQCSTLNTRMCQSDSAYHLSFLALLRNCPRLSLSSFLPTPKNAPVSDLSRHSSRCCNVLPGSVQVTRRVNLGRRSARMQFQLKAINIELLESNRVFLTFNSVMWINSELYNLKLSIKDTNILR